MAALEGTVGKVDASSCTVPEGSCSLSLKTPRDAPKLLLGRSKLDEGESGRGKYSGGSSGLDLENVLPDPVE